MLQINELSIVCYNKTIVKKNPQPKPFKKGNISCENGAKPKPHEWPTAYALADAGYDIRFIPNSKVIGMADSYINNTIFEFKAPEGKTINSVERNIRKALDHQSPNIVIDSFRIKNVQDRSIQSFLIGRLQRGHGIMRIFFIDRKRNVVDINKLVR